MHDEQYTSDDKNRVDEHRSIEAEDGTLLELQKELADCLVLQQEWKERFLRINADFENYKRRMVREQTSWLETCQQKIFLDLLPIVDDFDRALQTSPSTEETKIWIEGFILIRSSLQKMLASFGVEPMKNYQDFDPLYHEAIAQIASDTKRSGAIVEVLQPGYVWKEKVLRPAKVVVAQ